MTDNRVTRIGIVAAMIASILIIAPPAQAVSGTTLTPTDSLGAEFPSDTGTYDLVLNVVPTGDVTVTVSPDAQVTVDKTTLTFTTLDWFTPQTVTVTPVNDALSEGTHPGVVSHTASGGGYDTEVIDDYTITITDDDNPTVSIADDSGAEGGSVTFNVTLSTASGQTVTVDYDTSDNASATAGDDYTAASGTVTFLPGSVLETITVSTLQDTLDEVDETFTVTLSNPVNTSITGGTTATGTITDDDLPPTVSIADGSGVEGSSVTLNVTLSTASGKTVTVDYATSDNASATAGVDYTTKSGTVTFVPGDIYHGFDVHRYGRRGGRDIHRHPIEPGQRLGRGSGRIRYDHGQHCRTNGVDR